MYLLKRLHKFVILHSILKGGGGSGGGNGDGRKWSGEGVVESDGEGGKGVI